MGSERGEGEGADASREPDTKADAVQEECSCAVNKFLKSKFGFSLRESIGNVREQVNSQLSDCVASLKKASDVVQLPLSMRENLATKTYALSENLNEQFPFAASILTSHPTMVMSGGVIATVAVLRKLPTKWCMAGALGVFSMVKGTAFVFTYKWNNPLPGKNA